MDLRDRSSMRKLRLSAGDSANEVVDLTEISTSVYESDDVEDAGGAEGAEER
jgi:hypothetical protein